MAAGKRENDSRDEIFEIVTNGAGQSRPCLSGNCMLPSDSDRGMTGNLKEWFVRLRSAGKKKTLRYSRRTIYGSLSECPVTVKNLFRGSVRFLVRGYSYLLASLYNKSMSRPGNI